MPFAGLAKKQLVLRSGVVIGAAVSMALGCQLIVKLDAGPEQASLLDATGSLESGTDADVLKCGTRPLPPPDAEVLPGTGRSYYFIILPGTAAEDAGTGFDIDCIDTHCDESPPKLGCRPAPSLTYCDLPNGVDDQLTIAAGRRGLSRKADPYINRVMKGEDGIMFAILGYHGDASDSVVGFSMFPTSGIRSPNPCIDAEASDPPTPDDAGYFYPRVNGCDTFSADGRYAQNGVPLAIVQGYVNGDFVVVRSPMPMWLPSGARLIEAEVDYIQARRTLIAVTDGGPLQLHLVGVMSGRISPLAILRSIGEDRPDGGDVLCKSPGWDQARAALCQELDLAYPDAGSPDEPCGAISFSLPFDGYLAKLGDQAAPLDEPPSECDLDADANSICPR
jgi:hypothetical protein